MNDIVLYAVLALIPALLWLIPGTRRRTGNWITVWKTVPLGCFATLLVPTLLYGIARQLGQWGVIPVAYLKSLSLNLALGLCGLSLGILLIAFPARYLRRRYHRQERYPRWPFVVTFLLLGLAAALLPMLVYMLNPRLYQDRWVSFRLPDEGNTRIAFEQCSIHPFLAEYNYRIRFRRDGRTVDRYLITNTGGRTEINIYRLRDGRLCFVEKAGGYLVDPEKMEIFLLLYAGGEFYVAPFGDGPYEGHAWSYPKDGKVEFRYGDRGEWVYALPLTDELDGKIHYGSITDDFYTAAAQPELKLFSLSTGYQ